MPESVESFVKKLQAEGVDAGKEAAKKIKAEAVQEAEKLLADAKNEAEKIIATAKNDAEKQRCRAQTELELAVRDTILKLRESLGRVLSTLLTKRIERKLSERDYLGEIMREVIAAYAKADAAHETRIEINVSKEMGDELKKHVLKDLFQNLKGTQDTMGLQATLSKAGFEYKINDATVEVSADSVSALLSKMVSPALQEIIDEVVGKQDGQSQGERPGNKGESRSHVDQGTPKRRKNRHKG